MITSSKQTIIFYGPVGNGKKNVIGGGESGNRKTIALLKSSGFDVKIVEKPYPLKTPVIRGLAFPFQLIISIVKFGFTLIKTPGKKSAHISGFYNHLIYFEYVLVLVSKLLGVKCIYEIRAGGMIEGYKTRSPMYRLFFKATIDASYKVLCQGKEYLNFLIHISKTTTYYYPNYVLDSDLEAYNLNGRDESNKVKLIYFGRITASKNLEFIIDVCASLKRKNQNFSLDLIGGGTQEYVQSITDYINKNNVASYVTIVPPSPHKQLLQAIKLKHFFIFPTVEKREGHSNSLTEAMSLGVVPIASNIGFNKTVILEDELIIEDFDADLYAQKVATIWNNGLWQLYSKKCYDHVSANFTERKVKYTLASAHTLIM